MSKITNITVQDVFEMDIGFGPHYYVVLMEDTPDPNGMVLALYFRTYYDPQRHDAATLLYENEHQWLTEKQSWVCYETPVIALKQSLLPRISRIAKDKMELSVFKRIVDDFITIKSDNLSETVVDKYFELRLDRVYYSMSHQCDELAYFPDKPGRT